MSTVNGTIKRITDKGFGFITAPDGVEYFFHQSACTSTPFDSLREGDGVTFSSARAPRARAPRTSSRPSPASLCAVGGRVPPSAPHSHGTALASKIMHNARAEEEPMIQWKRWMLAGAIVALGSVGHVSGQADCDRACLRTMLDQYLAAVVKHDPSAAPLRRRVPADRERDQRATRCWRVEDRNRPRQDAAPVLDAVSGQAGYYGLIEEGDGVAVTTVRVRVQNRKLTEAEWYLARANDPGLNGPRQPGRPPANLHNPDYLIANPPPERVVPRAQRLSRDELVAVTNSYFDAITSHDGSVALTHPGCGRAENGSPAPAGRFFPRPAGAAAPAANAAVQRLRVGAGQLQPLDGGRAADSAGGRRSADGAGAWPFSSAVRARRRRATCSASGSTSRRAGSGPSTRRCSTRRPTLAVPNWPPYDGNWPLPASTVPAPAPPPAQP